MAGSTAHPVTVSTESGVVTARITSPSVEETEASAILDSVRVAMDGAGADLRFVVLDFEGVEFINSAGIGTCVVIHETAVGREAQVVLHAVKDDVLMVLQLARLDSIFKIAADEQALDMIVGH